MLESAVNRRAERYLKITDNLLKWLKKELLFFLFL